MHVKAQCAQQGVKLHVIAVLVMKRHDTTFDTGYKVHNHSLKTVKSMY